MCNQGEEDLVHFTMECSVLEGVRDYNLIDEKVQDSKDRMVELLSRQKKYQEVGNMLKNLWNRRRCILKFKEDERNRIEAMNDTVGSTRSDPGPEENRYTPIERGVRALSVPRG